MASGNRESRKRSENRVGGHRSERHLERRDRGAGLSRQQIAEAALKLADAEGFKAVSMRRLASELGVGTMTLYHYVRTKGELVALMIDHGMEEILIPEGEMPGDWRTAFEEIARRSLNAHMAHPWVVEAGSETGVGANALHHVEQSLTAAAMAGLEGTEAFELILMVDDYVYGYVARAREEAEEAADPDYEERIEEFIEEAEGLITPEQHPHLTAFIGGDPKKAMKTMAHMGRDPERFERGLATLLDGFELNLATGTSERSKS